MERPSVWLTGRNAIIAAAAAIVLNPLAIFVGYHIGRSLASPELSVKYVEAEPVTKPFSLQSDTFKLISGDALLYGLVVNKLPDWCNTWIKTGQIEKYCVDSAVTALDAVVRHIDNEIEVHKSNIEVLQSWDGKSELQLVPPLTFELKDLVTYAYNDKARAITISMMLFRRAKLFKEKALKFRAELAALQAIKEARTEEVVFKLGILNSGDSDGAIMPNAGLEFGSKILPLKQIRKRYEEYAVIKAHSFSEARFVVDAKTCPPEAWEIWRALVINRAQEPFRVNLETSDGKLTALGRLPP